MLKRSAGSPSEESLTGQDAGFADSLKDAVKAGVASGIHALVRELQITNKRLALLESKLDAALAHPSGAGKRTESGEWLGASMVGGHVPHAVPEDKEALTLFEPPLEEQTPEQGSLFKREAKADHKPTGAEPQAGKEPAPATVQAAPSAGVAEKIPETETAKDMGAGLSQEVPMVAEPPLQEETAKTASQKAEAVADIQEALAEAPPKAEKAEEERKAAEARKAEEEKKAAEARKAEEEKKAAEARKKAEEERKAAEAKKAEEEKKAAE
ncbi:MAG: hypothetical protein ACOCWR_05045, partial [Oceanidesulfovibrio sp.]